MGPPEGILKDAFEEHDQFLVALLLGVLDADLERLDVLRGAVEHAGEVVVLILGVPRQVGHLFSLLGFLC
jgi:hypothetical protein